MGKNQELQLNLTCPVIVDVVPADGGASVGTANLTALLLAHVLTQGISKVLLVVVALVGLPWMVAGAALTASLVSFRR